MLKALISGLLSVAVSVSVMAEEKPQLNVYNWSHYIAENTVSDFQKATGIEVTYSLYDSNEMLEGKLLAGRSGFDVVVPSGYFVPKQIQAGVYEELDRSKIPNWKNLDPFLMEKLSAFDQGNRFTIPYLWGTTGIGYNPEKVKGVLGEDASLDSWSLIFDPEKISKLSSCGVAILDEPTEVLATILAYLGKDPNSKNITDWKLAGDHLAKLIPHVQYISSSRFVDGLAGGDLCVAMGYSGGVFQAAASGKANGVDIQYFIPKEGASLWYDLVAMPKDAMNKESGYQFLNYILEPEVTADISNYVSYANANAKATPFVDESLRKNPGVYPSQELMDTLFVVQPPATKLSRSITRIWNKAKTDSKN
ncbi:polyamine ABC transporter substrate-binding protein [Endozoicomonas ascidiicola]|uniref:polyamine ABC transporter substrate-binding protein n=1 Tax=Endozoicomonas ascidiicola TaxID=1698521 RepID=UPI000A3E3C57|nr:polyamine ABC transporter substrate-binding protein [Endozoicomonas ascidiicola]